MSQKEDKANELFLVTDENDQPLAPLPRKLVHGHNIWHRSAHVWILNNQGQILCQQRSLYKESHPGFWESFFGGHLRPGETYQSGAVREVNEELGIKLNMENLKFWKVNKYKGLPDGHNHEFQGIFVTEWNGETSELAFNDGEVEQVSWKEISEVKREVEQNGEKTWVQIGYELELLDYLQKA